MILFLKVPAPGYEPFEELGPSGTRNDASVVVVRTFNEDGKPETQGTGFFISKDGDLVASRHILDRASKAEVVTIEGKHFGIAGVVAEDSESDLVILRCDIPSDIIRPLKINEELPARGAKIMVRVSALLFSDGTVSSVRTIPGFGSVFEITAPVSAVASGSPVVDISGALLGVATHLSVGGKNIQVAIPSAKVVELERGDVLEFARWQATRAEYEEGSAEKYYRQALMLLWVGNYEEAVPHLLQAVRKSRDHRKAYELLAFCYDALDRPQDQSKALQRLIRLDPENVQSYLDLARIYGENGYYQEVLSILGHALKVRPNSIRALTITGWAHRMVGNPEQAVKTIKKALSVRADYDSAYVELGNAYLALGKEEWAQSAFTQATNVNPANTAAYLKLASLSLRLGQHDRAQSVLESAIEADSQNVDVMLELARTYLLDGTDKSKAIVLLTRADSARPRDPDILYNLGLASIMLGDSSTAHSYVQELADLDRKRARYLKQKASNITRPEVAPTPNAEPVMKP